MNALLRGQNVAITDSDDLSNLIIKSLLAISGINKNVDAVNAGVTPHSRTLTRYISEKTPLGLLSEMLMPHGLAHFSGLLSFSEYEQGSESFQRYPIKILMAESEKRSIAPVSNFAHEGEVTVSPRNLFFLPQKRTTTQDHIEIVADEINGLVTETLDHYLSELALSIAYERHLQKPYLNAPSDIQNGVPRPNHALAHHVRVVSYVDEIIDYFKHHAQDAGFRNYCEDLSLSSPHEIEIIKVLLAFSKTGRESEVGWQQDSVLYESYQKASCENMKIFMREHSICSDAELNEYVEILEHMGDPKYKFLGTPEEQKKNFG